MTNGFRGGTIYFHGRVYNVWGSKAACSKLKRINQRTDEKRGMKHHHLGTRVIGVGYIHPRGTGTEREGAARECILSSHFYAAVHGNTEMRMLVPPNGTSLSLSAAAAHLAWGCVQSTGEGGGWAVMLEPFQ